MTVRKCLHDGCNTLTSNGKCTYHQRTAWSGKDIPRIRGRAHQERRAIWLHAHPLCVHCLALVPPKATIGTEVDHVTPLSKGGLDDESNFQTLCSMCHYTKTMTERGLSVKIPIGLNGYPK
jgi:5-methylcytosine-specific restriction enzyme A